jgi:uncharacterized protein
MSRRAVAIAVIAKSPQPGRCKTRLCPPCTPHQAAALAHAALLDTLRAVAEAPLRARRVLVLDGPAGDWADGFEVVTQRGDGLAERLACAFADIDAPTFLIGMDTPQIAAAQIAAGATALRTHAATIGPASDGGYWGIGLRAADPAVFAGVPMSAGDTAARQSQRLRALGIAPHRLAELRDVDTIADARAVARAAPWTRFARTLRSTALPARGAA